jgi:hydroxymethylpyrimidine/phosphomethylpyrimidine kinase
MTKPVALTIAGSDSGGGAGIQADIKAMEANGVYAASVLTSVTAQNTQAVQMAYDLPTQIVARQIDAVANDLDIRVAKTGMLSAPEIIETVADRVQAHDLFPFVVDPVMISKSGFKLLKDEAVGTLKDTLIPLATTVTPNVHEAALLAGYDILTMDDVKQAARDIFELGPESVLVKGGHLDDDPEAVDVLYDGDTFRSFTASRVDTSNTHGTGCTFASAIAAHLAHGRDLPEAIDRAKRYLTGALRHSLDLGKGHGPTNHFFHLDADLAIAEVQSTAA